MDPRTAAHVLTQIAALRELRGEDRFRTRAYETAAKAVLRIETDDIGPMLHSGELAAIKGIGPATLSVLRDLVETGESTYLEKLEAETPASMIEMLRIPGLGLAKLHQLHEELDVRTIDDLESAARDGRLGKLKGFGPKTAEKILKGIVFLRESGTSQLFHRAAEEAGRLCAMLEAHPLVACAQVAGEVRRHMEVVGGIDVVASCRSDPARVAREIGNSPGVRQVRARTEDARHVDVRFVDGTLLHLHCVLEPEFGVALLRATGTEAHVRALETRLASRGFTISGDRIVDAGGNTIDTASEHDVYRHAGLAFIPPELREDRGEVDAAARDALPRLIELADLRGVLHCHSNYSDGTVSIAQMADAARARGWSYIGITDHSKSAFYAGGLSEESLRRQHHEIDELNAAATDGFRILKGIEADILADGALDYDDETRASFDFIVGSVHSRFRMQGPEMTARILGALDDPLLTILGHPTGRLLLSREPYPVDVDAVVSRAAERRVAIEVNADPHRLDLDWRYLQAVTAAGVPIAIGPDAHSPNTLDYVKFGVGMARKGWIERENVVNAWDLDAVMRFARKDRG